MGLLDDAIREHLDLKRARGADPGEVERAEREALGPVRRGPQDSYEESHDSGGYEYAERPVAYDDEVPAYDESAYRRDAGEGWEPATADHAPAAQLPHDHEDDDFEDEDDDGYDYEDDLEYEEYEDASAASPVGLEQAPPAPAPAPAPDPPQRLQFSDEEIYRDEPAPRAAAPGTEGIVRRPDEFIAPADRVPGGVGEPTAEFDVEQAMAAEDAAWAAPPAGPAPELPPPANAARRSPQAPPDAEEDLLEETPDFLNDTPDHDRLWFEQKPPRDFDFDG